MDFIKLILINLKTFAILAIVILVINFLTPINDAFVRLLDRLAPPSTAQVVSSQTIINSITELGELVTVSAEISKMDVFIEVNKDRPEYYSARHRVTGIIEAGINFAEIDRDSVIYDTEQEYYTLILPPAIIRSCDILAIEQYGWNLTVLQAPWDKVRQLAQYVSSLQFAEDMAEADILEVAEREAEMRLGDFVSSVTGKPVVINFRERAQAIDYNEVCGGIEAPRGWKETEDGGWIQTE